MKKSNIVLLLIALILFLIPFFWLSPGFVDLGGDSGRLYFLDPFADTKSLFENQTPRGILLFSFIPYQLVLYGVKEIVSSPRILIAIEQGLQLSLAFAFITLSIRRLLRYSKESDNTVIDWFSLLGGFVYIGLITKTGWITSLETFNQIFLNPLLFYLLLEYMFTHKKKYLYIILSVTLVFSGNFGFSAAPQLLSFFPFAIAFLCFYFFWILRKNIPWKGLLFLFILFIGIHAFHIIPTLVSIFETEGSVNNQIFSQQSLKQSGLHYFDVNRQNFGKLSTSLFQPANWDANSLFIFIIPIIIVLGFIKNKSKLLLITGWFFAVSYFLVSANITLLGVRFYRQLFNIPGFLMFRSFYEKWHYLYAFFLSLLFAFSLYYLLKGKKKTLLIPLFLLISLGIVYRIHPFIKGDHNTISIYQSKNVRQVFDMDEDLIETLDVVKSLPNDGKILTLPLTAAYFQIFYGKTSGAYIGVSAINQIGGKKDIPGFWSFGEYSDDIIDAIKSNNKNALMQYLSLLNVRYIFTNSDERIFDKFPQHPFDPSLTNSTTSKESNDYMNAFLQEYKAVPFYQNGFYSLATFPEKLIRPKIYIPEIIYDSKEKMIQGESMRSSFIDSSMCQKYIECNSFNDESLLTINSLSPSTQKFSLDIQNRKKPFMIVFSEPYSSFWKLSFQDEINDGIEHVFVNEYANAWIIDPSKLSSAKILQGTIHMQFTRYIMIGAFVSVFSIGFVIISGIFLFIRSYAKRKSFK